MPKKKLLFIYPNLYTFIQTEIDLLSDDYDIISITQKWSNKILLPFNLTVQFFFLLYNLLFSNKLSIICLLRNRWGQNAQTTTFGHPCNPQQG